MSIEAVMTLAQQALYVTALVGGPPLVAALAAGLVVAVLQAVTQINEMTLSFIPKLAVMLVVLVLAGPWMLTLLVDYSRHLFTSLPDLIR